MANSVCDNQVDLHPGSHCRYDQLCFSVANHIVATQLTSSLATLVAEKVPAIRIAMRHFSGRRDLEPAFHSLMGLLFWHFSNSETPADVCITSDLMDVCIDFPWKEPGSIATYSPACKAAYEPFRNNFQPEKMHRLIPGPIRRLSAATETIRQLNSERIAFCPEVVHPLLMGFGRGTSVTNRRTGRYWIHFSSRISTVLGSEGDSIKLEPDPHPAQQTYSWSIHAARRGRGRENDPY